ncbi:MAG: GrpB family protein, partial [Gemmatimonadaceae bacterium]|nr:GrpB family protein [Gloeobacterales cyanobacterium ES-bin-141]
MPQPIVIVDYDPGWPGLFEELRTPVASILGGLALSIEHVGSTSVPGLAAKPIIDMDVVV